MKAVLQYTNCMEDERRVFGILGILNVAIKKSIPDRFSIYPKIIIKIENYSELNNILYILNENTTYGVKLLKMKKSLFERT